MLVGSRSLVTLLTMSLLVTSGWSVGCRKETNKAESGLNGASVKQSLESLKPRLASLNAKFGELRKQVAALPANLPGVDGVRTKFFNTDEGLGVMGPKLEWLSGRLEAALKAGNREELEQVRKDVAQTHEEFTQIDRIGLEVVHQLLPFQKLAELSPAENAAFVRVLSTGQTIKAERDGLEQRLLEFLDDPQRSVDKATWFSFDRLRFTGTGALLDKESSEAQLNALYEILRAYPTLTLEIAGYGESAAPAAANKKLSAQRAQTVKQELVQRGVAPARLNAESSAAERPATARVALRVATK